jgi:hypothetical protein
MTAGTESDTPHAPRDLSLRTVYQGRFRRASLRLADRTEIQHEVENHSDAVAVLSHDSEA